MSHFFRRYKQAHALSHFLSPLSGDELRREREREHEWRRSPEVRLQLLRYSLSPPKVRGGVRRRGALRAFLHSDALSAFFFFMISSSCILPQTLLRAWINLDEETADALVFTWSFN